MSWFPFEKTDADRVKVRHSIVCWRGWELHLQGGDSCPQQLVAAKPKLKLVGSEEPVVALPGYQHYIAAKKRQAKIFESVLL